MKIIKYLGVFLISSLLAYFLSPEFGKLYLALLPLENAGSFVNGTSIIGLPLGYIFFTCLLVPKYEAKKYWYVLLFLLSPAILIELYFEKKFIYLPILVGFFSWFLGVGIEKLIRKIIISKSKSNV